MVRAKFSRLRRPAKIDATDAAPAGRTGMTRHFLRPWVVSVLVCGFAGAAQAAPATVLDRYLSDLTTLRAEFSQVVTDGRGDEVQRARGSFVIQRPGKFRWELTPGRRRAVAAAHGRRWQESVVLRS